MLLCSKKNVTHSNNSENKAMSYMVARATAMARSPCHHTLYRKSLATALATVVAIARAANLDTFCNTNTKSTDLHQTYTI